MQIQGLEPFDPRSFLGGSDEMVMYGKGWSVDRADTLGTLLDLPSLALNEAIMVTPASTCMMWDKTPLVHMARAALMGRARRTDFDLCFPDVFLGDTMILGYLRRFSGRRLVWSMGAWPRLRSSAAIAIYMIGAAGLKRIHMVGFDLFFRPEKFPEGHDGGRGIAPYSSAVIDQIRAPYDDTVTSMAVVRRSSDFTIVNRSIQEAAEATGVELIDASRR